MIPCLVAFMIADDPFYPVLLMVVVTTMLALRFRMGSIEPFLYNAANFVLILSVVILAIPAANAFLRFF